MLRKNLVLAALASVVAVGANAAWEKNQSLAGVYDYKVGDQLVARWLGVPFSKESTSSFAGVVPTANMMLIWESHKQGQALVHRPASVDRFIRTSKNFTGSEFASMSIRNMPQLDNHFTFPASYFDGISNLNNITVPALEMANKKLTDVKTGITGIDSQDRYSNQTFTGLNQAAPTSTTYTNAAKSPFNGPVVERMRTAIDSKTQQKLDASQTRIAELSTEIKKLQTIANRTVEQTTRLNSLSQQFETEKSTLRNTQISALRNLRAQGFNTGRLNQILVNQNRYLTPSEFKQVQQKMIQQVSLNSNVAINSRIEEGKFNTIPEAISFIKDNMEKTMSPVVLVGNVKNADERVRYMLATGAIYCPQSVCTTEIAGLFINDSGYNASSISRADDARKLAISPRTFVSQNELNAYWKPSGSALPWMRQHTFLYNGVNETASVAGNSQMQQPITAVAETGRIAPNTRSMNASF